MVTSGLHVFPRLKCRMNDRYACLRPFATSLSKDLDFQLGSLNFILNAWMHPIWNNYDKLFVKLLSLPHGGLWEYQEFKTLIIVSSTPMGNLTYFGLSLNSLLFNIIHPFKSHVEHGHFTNPHLLTSWTLVKIQIIHTLT